MNEVDIKDLNEGKDVEINAMLLLNCLKLLI